MRISHFGMTHAGCLREENEDALLLLPKANFFAVADGLGGLPDGSLASTSALDYIENHYGSYIEGDQLRIKELFEAANTCVHKLGADRHPGVGIGTTLTGLRLSEDGLLAGHVGDSSLYLVRDGKFHIVTEEHTMAAQLGATHDQKNNDAIPEFYYHTLTRCIGAAAEVEISIEKLETQPGDRLLLSTDGLIKVASSTLIAEVMTAAKKPKQLVELLLEYALENDCSDNVTMVAIFIGKK